MVNFVDTMIMGVGTITDAAKMLDEANADDYEPNRFEKFVAGKTGKSAMDVMMVFAVIVALALAVGLFFILPTFLTGLVKGSITSPLLLNLIDGLVRLGIFLAVHDFGRANEGHQAGIHVSWRGTQNHCLL